MPPWPPEKLPPARGKDAVSGAVVDDVLSLLLGGAARAIPETEARRTATYAIRMGAPLFNAVMNLVLAGETVTCGRCPTCLKL